MFLPHKVSDFLALCSTFRNLGTPVQIQSLDWLGGGSRSLTRRRWTWKEKSRRSLISEPSFNPKQEMGLLLIHVTTLSFHCYDEDHARQSKATILKSLRPFETRIYFQISILRSKMRIHGIIIFFLWPYSQNFTWRQFATVILQGHWNVLHNLSYQRSGPVMDAISQTRASRVIN